MGLVLETFAVALAGFHEERDFQSKGAPWSGAASQSCPRARLTVCKLLPAGPRKSNAPAFPSFLNTSLAPHQLFAAFPQLAGAEPQKPVPLALYNSLNVFSKTNFVSNLLYRHNSILDLVIVMKKIVYLILSPMCPNITLFGKPGLWVLYWDGRMG